MADLPSVRLTRTLPAADVTAVPTGQGTDGAQVLGTVPGDLPRLLERERAKGDAGELVWVPTDERVVLFGTGDGSPASLRKAGAALARRSASSSSLAVDLRELPLAADGLSALAEGLLLAVYGFTRKQSAEPRTLREVTLVVGDPTRLQGALDRAVVVIGATATARDLVNTPSVEKSPEWLATQASDLLAGLSVRVRDDVQLRAEGWGGVTAVGMGSSRPPRVVEATYDGGGSRHLVLVGKGITFDTGGLSIKPNDGMQTMKSDMGGAAAVLATLRAVADLRLAVTVTGVVCLAENMPSGTAQRPSDVISQYGGTTVEVLNTDAEGRLVLADGIAYAARQLNPDLIVDIATLTGAMPIALGRKIAGLFTDDEALSAGLLAAADRTGERLWRLPLVEDYRVALESTTADLRNIGDPKLKLGAGSIVAALFLREFTGGRPWAHLDIAGPAWSAADDDELTKGGTGYGVRLLVSWLESVSESRSTGRRTRRAG